MIRFSIFAFVLACTTAPIAIAQDLPPIEADRPDQTESPVLVPPYRFQVETGFSLERTDENASTVSHPTMLLKYGAGEHLELRLEWEWQTARAAGTRTTGIPPVTIGCKIHIAAEDGLIPETAFLGHLSLPDLASRPFRASTYAPAFLFSMQHSLVADVSLGYNLGAEWDGENPEPTFLYTLTSGLSLGAAFECFAEVYGFASRKQPTDHRVDAGFSWRSASNVQFDLSGGIGITSNAPEYIIGVGCSVRLMD